MNTKPTTTHSAGGIVINHSGKILVVSQQGDSWSLPKGHVEQNEEILMAAEREIAEESGVTELELLKTFPIYERYKIGAGGEGEDENELKVIHMFLFRTDQTDLKPIDPNNPTALWVDPEHVSEMLTHPKDKEFFHGVLSDVMMYVLSKRKAAVVEK